MAYLIELLGCGIQYNGSTVEKFYARANIYTSTHHNFWKEQKLSNQVRNQKSFHKHYLQSDYNWICEWEIIINRPSWNRKISKAKGIILVSQINIYYYFIFEYLIIVTIVIIATIYVLLSLLFSWSLFIIIIMNFIIKLFFIAIILLVSLLLFCYFHCYCYYSLLS